MFLYRPDYKNSDARTQNVYKTYVYVQTHYFNLGSGLFILSGLILMVVNPTPSSFRLEYLPLILGHWAKLSKLNCLGWLMLTKHLSNSRWYQMCSYAASAELTDIDKVSFMFLLSQNTKKCKCKLKTSPDPEATGWQPVIQQKKSY